MGTRYRVPTINVLSKNKKNITFFHLKIIIFTAVKNRCILHGRVFVMFAKFQGDSHKLGQSDHSISVILFQLSLLLVQ